MLLFYSPIKAIQAISDDEKKNYVTEKKYLAFTWFLGWKKINAYIQKAYDFHFFYEYKIRKYFLRKWSAINIFDNVLMEKVIKYKVFAKTYVLYKSLS